MTGIPAPGQFAVTSTGGWAAKVIQFVTRSPVNHAILCVQVGATGAAYCVEAQPSGARDVMARVYPDAIWSDIDLTTRQQQIICATGKSFVGRPYGWLDCVAAGVDSLRIRWGWEWLPRSRWALKRLASMKTMDCSQLVAMAYAAAGLTLVDDELPCQVSPGDLLTVVQRQHATTT